MWRGYRRLFVSRRAVTTPGTTAGPEDLQERRKRRTIEFILLTGLLSLAGWLVAGFTETVNNDTNVLMMFYFVMGIAVATSRGLLKNLKRV